MFSTVFKFMKGTKDAQKKFSKDILAPKFVIDAIY